MIEYQSKWSAQITKFYKEYCWNEILQLSCDFPDTKSLVIPFQKVELFDRELSKELLDHPGQIIEEFVAAIKEIDLPIDKTFDNVFVRFINLPTKSRIGDLRSVHLGKFISVEGMIRKATEVRPRITKAAFECQRCEYITYVEQHGYKFEEPFSGCENETCGKKGPFKVLIDESTFVDAQKLQVQEPPEDLRGTQARGLDIDVSDDITDLILPGDRVIITGILKSVQRTLKDGKSTFYDIYLDANHIEVLSTAFDELEITSTDKSKILTLSKDPEIFSKMVDSFAPLVKGMNDVKEALLLQQFSGVSKFTPDGSYLRGDSHILLCGDPAKAKTKLMKSAQARSPRAVFTSGKATTAAGLTAAVIKDEDKFGGGRYTVEGGALVMADKGVAFIDEGDKMRESDRDALHDAMEQQEIPLSKAGIMVTLKSRTAVTMSANPKYGKFDRYEGLAEQIDLPASLLSRFDLIFLLLDEPNEKEDSEISLHILDTHQAGELRQQRENGSISVSSILLEEAEKHIVPEIPVDLFKKYVAYAKKNYYPVLTQESKNHIHNFYMSLRKKAINSKKHSIPITKRQEEAIIRLAEASAKVRLSNEIKIEDAERATALMEKYLKTVGIDPSTGEADISGISSGITLSQINAIKTIKEIMKNLGNKFSNGAIPVMELVAEAVNAGIKKERAEGTIQKLAEKGDILKINQDHVKLVN